MLIKCLFDQLAQCLGLGLHFLARLVFVMSLLELEASLVTHTRFRGPMDPLGELCDTALHRVKVDTSSESRSPQSEHRYRCSQVKEKYIHDISKVTEIVQNRYQEVNKK
jgi:hypothetical protein